jgi:hypothetical protein
VVVLDNSNVSLGSTIKINGSEFTLVGVPKSPTLELSLPSAATAPEPVSPIPAPDFIPLLTPTLIALFVIIVSQLLQMLSDAPISGPAPGMGGPS